MTTERNTTSAKRCGASPVQAAGPAPTTCLAGMEANAPVAGKAMMDAMVTTESESARTAAGDHGSIERQEKDGGNVCVSPGAARAAAQQGNDEGNDNDGNGGDMTVGPKHTACLSAVGTEAPAAPRTDGGTGATAAPVAPGVSGINPLYARLLAPLSAHYGDPATLEIRLSRPHRVVTDRRGEGKRMIEDASLSQGVIERIARSLANAAGLAFDGDTSPKLSCILPGGHRFEALVGPSVRTGGVSLAVRCKHPFMPAWEHLGATPAIRDYLIDVARSEKNLVISGATNTGKTTLLNMLLAVLDEDRRVVAVEDTPELDIERFWDGVGLIAAREEGTGSGMMGWRPLYDHIMRITPDNIVFGEISTQNAFAALAALNAGVRGFMCTIHAESPEQAINRKFAQNVAWSGEHMENIPAFLVDLIDVVVQIRRSPDGYRRITDIREPKNDRWVLKDGEKRHGRQ